MDLHLSSGQYHQGGVEGSVQAASSSPAPAVISGRYDAGSLNLINGQILSGEITGIEGKEIQILLSNNQTINARLTADISLFTGQFMSFQVKQGNGSQIALTPLFENMEGSPAVMKALGEAGMPVNEKTAAMVTAMMEEGMSVSRDNLFSMFRNVSHFETADIKTLVQMTKLQIPLTEENVAQFKAYQQNQHQIADSVMNLSEGLASLAGEEGKETALKLLEIFAKEAPAAEVPVTEQGAVITKGGEEAARPAVPGTDLPANAQPEQPVAAVLDAPGRETFVSQLEAVMESQGLPLSEELAEGIRNGTADTGDVLKQLAELVRSAPLEADKAVAELLKGDGFKSLLKENIAGQWLFVPEDVEDKEKVDALYRRILGQTERTEQLLGQLGKGNSSLMKETGNLRQNVQFMNQLNQMFTYLQLPLKLGEKKGHGDLYVYTNKKKLAEKDGEVTALLHLEMEHLGTMDIHVALRDGNHVKTHFMLEKEEYLDFIEEHLPMLDEHLKRRGYEMSAQTSIKEGDGQAPNMAVAEMIGHPDGGMNQLVAKYSFDARA